MAGLSHYKFFAVYSIVLMLVVCSWSVAETPNAEDSSADNISADNTKTPSVPPAPKTYQGRTIAQTMHYLGAPWLTRESREREEQCTTLMNALKVKEGDTVCDMGCGNGFYTLKLAPLVGDQGKILAVDIQPKMLGLLRARAETADIHNIRPILSTIVDPKLPIKEVDLMLLVDVYHEFSHPAAMLKAIHRSLKPKGRVALVEFRQEDLKVPIKELHKMSIAQIMKEFPPNGFKLVGQFDRLPWQHVMFFARDDSPLPKIKATPWKAEPVQ